MMLTMLRTTAATLLVAAAAGALPAQELWAPKGASRYLPPHKPITRWKDLAAKHKGATNWRQVIVNDEHLRSEYIVAAPGTRIPRQLRPDTRIWWVVMEGEVRFDIETTGAFVAKKGSMVQAPMATLFEYEVVGATPAVIFETNIAGAKTIYARREDAPRLPGIAFLPVSFRRQAGVFGRNNKVHATYDEVAQALDSGKLKGTQRIVEDARGAANFIYGREKDLPPIDPKQRGHYHPECAEYWLILSGQIRYPIEGQGVIIADPGDVVYVPRFTWHMPRWYGPAPSCRLAMNGYPEISHLFDAQN